MVQFFKLSALRVFLLVGASSLVCSVVANPVYDSTDSLSYAARDESFSHRALLTRDYGYPADSLSARTADALVARLDRLAARREALEEYLAARADKHGPSVDEWRTLMRTNLASIKPFGWVFWTSPVTETSAMMYDIMEPAKWTWYGDVVKPDDRSPLLKGVKDDDAVVLARYSAALALEATGEIMIFVQGVPNKDKIFWQYEFAFLLANPKVTKITVREGDAGNIDIAFNSETVILDRAAGIGPVNPWQAQLGTPPTPNLATL